MNEVWNVVDRHFEPRYVVKYDVPGDALQGFTSICQPEDPNHCHLISAAPEMLEALKAALDRMETVEECRSLGFVPACEAAIVFLRYVIAKAEGSEATVYKPLNENDG